MTKQLLSHFDREGIIWRCNAPPSQKLLMLALNSFVDGEGKCYPGVERLAKMMGASAATVKRAINELEAAGVVKRESRRLGCRQASNLYTVNFEKISSSFCTPEASAGQFEPLNQSKLSPPAAQNEPRQQLNLHPPAAQNEPRSIQSLSIQSLSVQDPPVVPRDRLAEQMAARKLNRKDGPFDQIWESYQRNCIVVGSTPGSRPNALTAWAERFPDGAAPPEFLEQLEAYWEIQRANFQRDGKAYPVGLVRFINEPEHGNGAIARQQLLAQTPQLANPQSAATAFKEAESKNQWARYEAEARARLANGGAA